MAQMQVICNTYADFKAAVAGYLGSTARIGFSLTPNRQNDPIQGAAYSADSSRSVHYQFATDTPPSGSQLLSDFPTAIVFSGDVTFGG